MDDAWFYGGCIVILFVVCQVAGVPFGALPFLLLVSFFILFLVMVLFVIVTLPGRTWMARRHRSK